MQAGSFTGALIASRQVVLRVSVVCCVWSADNTKKDTHRFVVHAGTSGYVAGLCVMIGQSRWAGTHVCVAGRLKWFCRCAGQASWWRA